jgi:hypothetical protein
MSTRRGEGREILFFLVEKRRISQKTLSYVVQLYSQEELRKVPDSAVLFCLGHIEGKGSSYCPRKFDCPTCFHRRAGGWAALDENYVRVTYRPFRRRLEQDVPVGGGKIE